MCVCGGVGVYFCVPYMAVAPTAVGMAPPAQTPACEVGILAAPVQRDLTLAQDCNQVVGNKDASAT